MGSITDLEQWRKTHGPAVRCLTAMRLAWWNWATLPWVMMGKLKR